MQSSPLTPMLVCPLLLILILNLSTIFPVLLIRNNRYLEEHCLTYIYMRTAAWCCMLRTSTSNGRVVESEDEKWDCVYPTILQAAVNTTAGEENMLSGVQRLAKKKCYPDYPPAQISLQCRLSWGAVLSDRNCDVQSTVALHRGATSRTDFRRFTCIYLT